MAGKDVMHKHHTIIAYMKHGREVPHTH